jgi:hypothetical protein
MGNAGFKRATAEPQVSERTAGRSGDRGRRRSLARGPVTTGGTRGSFACTANRRGRTPTGAGGGVSVVLETAGGAISQVAFDLLTSGSGRLVIYGTTSGEPPRFDPVLHTT